MPNLQSQKPYYRSNHDCFRNPTNQANGRGGLMDDEKKQNEEEASALVREDE